MGASFLVAPASRCMQEHDEDGKVNASEMGKSPFRDGPVQEPGAAFCLDHSFSVLCDAL